MWKLTPFYSYRTNTATTSNFIMKFLFIYCVQVLWKNLHIQYCWNQTSSRLQCQHNLPKVPAHYVTLTSSTVWLLDSNILLYTYVRKKQIYSIRLKWNNFRLVCCKICISCMVPVWQYCIYTTLNSQSWQSGPHMVAVSYTLCMKTIHHKIYLQCVPFPCYTCMYRKIGIWQPVSCKVVLHDVCLVHRLDVEFEQFCM